MRNNSQSVFLLFTMSLALCSCGKTVENKATSQLQESKSSKSFIREQIEAAEIELPQIVLPDKPAGAENINIPLEGNWNWKIYQNENNSNQGNNPTGFFIFDQKGDEIRGRSVIQLSVQPVPGKGDSKVNQVLIGVPLIGIRKLNLENQDEITFITSDDKSGSVIKNKALMLAGGKKMIGRSIQGSENNSQLFEYIWIATKN